MSWFKYTWIMIVSVIYIAWAISVLFDIKHAIDELKDGDNFETFLFNLDNEESDIIFVFLTVAIIFSFSLGYWIVGLD